MTLEELLTEVNASEKSKSKCASVLNLQSHWVIKSLSKRGSLPCRSRNPEQQFSVSPLEYIDPEHLGPVHWNIERFQPQ